jgi:pimeloyl-ACP methyl ester carboxylesterase
MSVLVSAPYRVPNGQVLIAVPGLGRTAESLPLSAFEPLLAAGVTLLRVYPGDGATASISVMAAEVWRAVTPYLSGMRVYLLGYSMGGFVVQCMYAQRPLSVCGMVFVSTTAPDVLDLLVGLLHPRNNTLEASAAAYPVAAIRSLHLSDVLTGEMTRAATTTSVPHPVFLKQVTAVVAYMVSCHAPVITKHISCPVLIIYGTADGIIPEYSLMKMKVLLRDSPSVTERVLPGVSHYIMIEAHAEFGRALEQWMATQM